MAETAQSIAQNQKNRAMTDRTCTAIVLFYRKNQKNYRLLFGHPQQEIRRGWHRKLAVFEPGELFAYERWEANSYGTQRWQIMVCRTAQNGSVTRVPGVHPGAKLLLRVNGKTKSKRFLSCLDGLKSSAIAPETIRDRIWMELGLALNSGANLDEALAIIEAKPPC